MPDATPMPPLTRKEVKAFRALSEEDQRDYLRARLHDEAEVWLEYFMRAGGFHDLLSSKFLLRPPQR